MIDTQWTQSFLEMFSERILDCCTSSHCLPNKWISMDNVVQITNPSVHFFPQLHILHEISNRVKYVFSFICFMNCISLNPLNGKTRIHNILICIIFSCVFDNLIRYPNEPWKVVVTKQAWQIILCEKSNRLDFSVANI